MSKAIILVAFGSAHLDGIKNSILLLEEEYKNRFNNEYLVSGYSSYEDGSYLSKFIRYSDALKVLGVES